MSRRLGLAGVLAAGLTGGSIAVRLANPYGIAGPSPSELVPFLWAVALVVALVLTRAWAPTIAWSAAVTSTTAAALGDIDLVRTVRGANGGMSGPGLDALLVVALVTPLMVGAAYATADGRRPRIVGAAAWGLAFAIAGVLAGNWVRRTLGMEAGGLPEWLWVAGIATLTAAGLLRDVRPAAERTRARLAAAGAVAASGGGTRSAARVFLDELVPGREAGRAEAAESERGRLAAELHAEVLPSLRHALAAAEAGGSVEQLARDLGTAVEDVESLMARRRSIVLEETGLLAAVEWLAERVEDRSTARVAIEVETQPGPRAEPAAGHLARPPRQVERAAFRVVQLALDNVVRHVPGAGVTVSVGMDQEHVHVAVADDGEGPAIDEAAAIREGRRGLADMRAEAGACGARLDVGRGPGGRGTVIRFDWPG